MFLYATLILNSNNSLQSLSKTKGSIIVVSISDSSVMCLHNLSGCMLKPNFAEAYISRGLAKYGSGDKKGACLDLNKAEKLGYLRAYDLIKQYCD